MSDDVKLDEIPEVGESPTPPRPKQKEEKNETLGGARVTDRAVEVLRLDGNEVELVSSGPSESIVKQGDTEYTIGNELLEVTNG